MNSFIHAIPINFCDSQLNKKSDNQIDYKPEFLETYLSKPLLNKPIYFVVKQEKGGYSKYVKRNFFIYVDQPIVIIYDLKMEQHFMISDALIEITDLSGHTVFSAFEVSAFPQIYYKYFKRGEYIITLSTSGDKAKVFVSIFQ